MDEHETVHPINKQLFSFPESLKGLNEPQDIMPWYIQYNCTAAAKRQQKDFTHYNLCK